MFERRDYVHIVHCAHWHVAYGFVAKVSRVYSHQISLKLVNI